MIHEIFKHPITRIMEISYCPNMLRIMLAPEYTTHITIYCCSIIA